MQPTQPITGAEKAAQFAGRAIPGMAMGGASGGARAAMGAAPAANAVRGMGLAAQGPVSSLAKQAPGEAAQQGFLKQAAAEAIKMGGHTLGPVGSVAARFVPKILGLE